MLAETDVESTVITKHNNPLEQITIASNFLSSIDSTFPYPTNDYGKRFVSKIELDYHPSYIREIGGVWLLVAGRDHFAEIYSQGTMRRANVLKFEGRVTCVACSVEYCFVGLTNREI